MSVCHVCLGHLHTLQKKPLKPKPTPHLHKKDNQQTRCGQHYPSFSETQSVEAYHNLSFTE